MMPSIPLPFVVALLLAVLFVRIVAQRGRFFRPTTVFVAACILLLVTVGLRWTTDLRWIRFLQPVVAALLPPIAWFCFAELRGPNQRRYWPHLLVPVTILILSASWQNWHSPIDLVLALLYFGYAASLAHRAFVSHGNFDNARLADGGEARRAVLVVAGLLSASGMIDLLIAADFDLYRGSHAASIVAAANMLTLPLVAYAIAVMGRSVPESDASLPEETPVAAEFPTAAHAATDDHHRHIVETIEAAMRDKKLFRDPDLTLRRLSRRLAIPSRQISAAINRTSSRNVSQVVNEYRVREAMRLLRETNLPITAAMLESGFQTKSNFNREFLRVTGTTPREYRRGNTGDASDAVTAQPGSPSPGTR